MPIREVGVFTLSHGKDWFGMKAKLRDYQSDAAKAVLSSIQFGGRCKAIMPCGTGKTLVGISVAETIGIGRRMLIQAPSLALIKQLLDEYAHELSLDGIMVVCSDDSTAEEARKEYDIPEVTTDPQEIAARMKASPRLTVFCTYQSTERIAEAVAVCGSPGFDFALFDEAHRMVGASSTFNAALDDSKVPVVSRLFMTATPRFACGESFDGYEYVSMDDVSQFGEVAYEMRMSAAIEAGHLTDYEVCVFVVKESELQGQIANDENARDVAKRLAIAKAIERRGLRKMLVYHNSVAKMERFSRHEMPQTFAKLKEHGQITGELWSKSLTGKDKASKRSKLLNEFRLLNGDSRAILNNCRLLQEGVDVPAIDGIALLEPRTSTVDLVQMIGRMIRNSPDKKIATLVLPVFVPAGHEGSIEDFVASSEFSHVYRVLSAIKSHDDRIDSWATRGNDRDRNVFRLRVDGIDAEAIIGFEDDWLSAIECHVLPAFADRPMLTRELLTEWIQWYRSEYSEWPRNKSNNVFPDGSSVNAIRSSMKKKRRGWSEDVSLSQLVREVDKGTPKAELTSDLLTEWIKWYRQKYSEWPTTYSKRLMPDGSTAASIASAVRLGYRGWEGVRSFPKLVNEIKLSRPSLTRDLMTKWIIEYRDKYGEWPTQKSKGIFPDGSSCSAINSAIRGKRRGWTEDTTFSKLVSDVSSGDCRPVRLDRELLTRWVLWYRNEYSEWPKTTSKQRFPDGTRCVTLDCVMRSNYRGWTENCSLVQLVREIRASVEESSGNRINPVLVARNRNAEVVNA